MSEERVTDIPNPQFDSYTSLLGNPFDPFHLYLYAPPLQKYIKNFLTKPGYGSWDLLQDLTKSHSITSFLRDRSKGPVSLEKDNPHHTWMLTDLQYDKTYYPNRTFYTEHKAKQIGNLYRNYVTDIMATLFYNGCDMECTELDIRARDCIEYFGLKRGQHMCADVYQDYVECSRKPLQKLRALAMHLERRKRWFEYMKGEREYSTLYKPNPPAFLKRDSDPGWNFEKKFYQW